MRFIAGFRAALIALFAVACAAVSLPARADGGSISFTVIKAGFVIGGSAGSGSFTFHGRRYPLSIGGISYGFTFGASETRFHGTVSNIRRRLGCRRRLCRGQCGRRGRARRAGDRADQPARRGVDAHRQFGRRHCQRGPQRPGDYVAVTDPRLTAWRSRSISRSACGRASAAGRRCCASRLLRRRPRRSSSAPAASAASDRGRPSSFGSDRRDGP